MSNEWQNYTRQLHRAEIEHSTQTELPVDSVLLMMARYLISARRSHPRRRQLHSAPAATPTLSTVQAQPYDRFDK